MATKRAKPIPTRRARNGSGNTLTSGISELLRTLGGILGHAYADNVEAACVEALESAKNALIEARRIATADE